MAQGTRQSGGGNLPSCGRGGRASRDRRIALLRRAGLFGGDTLGARVARAATHEDLLGAYRLVHNVYVRNGYVAPDPSGIRVRPFEALPDTATFAGKAGGEVVGVLSLVMDNPDLGLPSDLGFRTELDTVRGEGRRLCEATNQVVADTHRSTALATELMRCAFAHAMATGCTDFVGTVSPSHVGFYELLGFERISPVRSYSQGIDDPVAVVRLDIAGLDARFRGLEDRGDEVEAFLKSYYIDDNPYHRYVATWQILAARALADPLHLRALFVEESSLLDRCGPEALAAIRKAWGEKLFSEVWVADAAAMPAT